MGRQELFNKLLSLKNIKNNWYSVAEVCEQLKARTAENAYPARRIREASDVINYSVNILNRMISVRVFLNSVREKINDFEKTDFNSVSFPSLELVKRLYQVDPAAGLEMLPKVVGGEIKIKDLSKHYADKMAILGGHSSGHIARKESQRFQDAALGAIKLQTEKIFELKGDGLSFQLQVQNDFADVVLTSGYPGRQLSIGIIFETLNCPGNKERYKSFIEKSALYGLFFDEYWTVFPSTADSKKVESYIKMLDILVRDSYGVLLVHWGDGEPVESRHIEILKPAYLHEKSVLCNFKSDFDVSLINFCS